MTMPINRAEITTQLREMTEKRLFSGDPLPADDWEVAQKFVDLGLVERDEDHMVRPTALGLELSEGLWAAMMGHHALYECPHVLAEYGLITTEEVDHLANRWERNEEIESIVLPILRRVFREVFQY